MSSGGQKGFLRGFFFWALSIFLLGMGMKLLLLSKCVNSLPYFDQWDAEAADVYIPYFSHTLRLTDFFRPHNEHRILFTRLYDLCLLVLNRQWDSQLQMVLNAVIHCATVAGFAWLMAILLGRRHWIFIWLPMAATVMSPFGWENTLWGFQSQFYFLLFFSLLAISLMAGRPCSLSWLLGLIAGICAIFSMASGLLVFVATGIVLFLEILKKRPELSRRLLALGLCGAFAFAGLLLLGKSGSDQAFAAHSAKDFFTALGNNLAWPNGFSPWFAPLNLFPLALFSWTSLRAPQTPHRGERIILIIGVWVILQSVALAIVRGADGRPPAWRYMDILCFLIVVNFLGAALLLFKYRSSLRFPRVCSALLLVWLVSCVAGLWSFNARAWNEILPLWSHFQSARVELTRQFLATDNDAVFANRDVRELPWDFTPGLVSLLRLKDIRSILPACVREPLKITPATGSRSSVFVPGGAKLDKPDSPTEFCLGSFSTNGVAAHGTFESGPLTSSLPMLQIPMAGNLGSLGQPGLSLQLVSLSTGKITEVKPASVPRGQWLNVDVKAPAGQFKLVARDESSTGWFAFKGPRELGLLSFWAEKIIGLSNYVLITGFLALAAALAAYFYPSAIARKTDNIVPAQNEHGTS